MKNWLSLIKHFNKLLLLLVYILSMNHACTCKNPTNWQPTKEKTTPTYILQISQDSHTGAIAYTVTNQGKNPVNEINLHYQCTTPGVELAGKPAYQLSLGPIAAGVTTPPQALGSIHFNGHPQANIDFWLELLPDKTHHSPQTKTFTAPQVTICRLEAIGSAVQVWGWCHMGM